jgi:hypothetical protein
MAAIDTFFWRLGDMLQAVRVFAGTHFASTRTAYTQVNIVLVAVWLVLVVSIFRQPEQPMDIR